MKRVFLLTTLASVAGVLGILILGSSAAHAVTDCTFTTSGSTKTLDGDCTTDETIFIADGETLDGNGNSITAVDPPAGHFVGGVVENGGATAHVTRLVVHGNLALNVCDAGASRLRGILFTAASGSITHNTVQNINQGASGCQEGNGIEVRNAPFDGTHPDTQSAEIAHNVVEDYQKGGIICNGDVDCWIHQNVVGQSFTQANLTANAVQLGFGAAGLVQHNHIAGNQNLIPGGADFSVRTAVLLFSVESAVVKQNNIGGNAQCAICVFSGNSVVDNNRIFERDADGSTDVIFDGGIVDIGASNSFTNNKVRGYDSPAAAFPDDGEISGTNVVSAPQDPGAACFLPDSSAQSC